MRQRWIFNNINLHYSYSSVTKGLNGCANRTQSHLGLAAGTSMNNAG